MNIFYSELADSLKTGFLNNDVPSKNEYRPQLLVNDKLKGVKILTTILKELRDCDEFWFSVAFLTKSGVATLINNLKELEAKNIKGKILVSQYQNFTQPEALKSMLKLSNIELRIAVDGNFHAKGYLFRKEEKYNLIIGSSNLTASALCTNKEWNIKVTSTNSGALIKDTINEFRSEFEKAKKVDNCYIDIYEEIYKAQQKIVSSHISEVEAIQKIEPNSMQVEALKNLYSLRKQGKSTALLISATGTGKTYLSAFDAKEVNPNKLLFVVHRANIAEAAMKSFHRVIDSSKKLGMYSGDKREIEADFLFSTIQTISKDYHLSQFSPYHFEYIVIDETHRAGAQTYQKILNHFKPKFLLGMTATPERTDGFDIFKQFNYNIAYEIRLHRALEEQMLCPFHYYGVTDVSVNNEVLEEDAAFNLLTANERVDRIIEKAKFYGCDDGCVRGLIFCSKVEEGRALSKAFNVKGYKTLALSGENSEEERALAISRLESDKEDKLDYIFTVDIFNEGIDIPRVNQIIMLRPTQSAIVFVQQLGRGLRRINGKEFVTVIDFIGNYSNNYLVPIALYGDTTYNKDTLRKLVASGSALIPGNSTVNFDRIVQERIYSAIDTARLSTKKDLLKDYQLLKFKIGSIPMMMDFVEHGSRDPFLYVEYSKSYFNFVATEESSLQTSLSPRMRKQLELFSNNIANAKRIEEVIIIKECIDKKSIAVPYFRQLLFDKYEVVVSDATIQSCISNLNFEFINAPEKVIKLVGNVFKLEDDFSSLLENKVFFEFIKDTLNYAEATYNRYFDRSRYIDGFILYHKYSRKDVCRILNWDRDEHSTMYGYKVKHGSCPIFVNYHKEENIASTTKYEDKFLNNYEFEWMSRSRRTLESGEIKAIQNYKGNLRLSLFVKKDNDEGNDFYYMGEVTPLRFQQTTMVDDNRNEVSVVKVNFQLSHPVEDSIYEYLTAVR
jgi:superfamily II DNA or RNA helicase